MARGNMVIRITCVAWLAVLPAVVGCEQSPYPLAPVRGTVTIDGQPLTHAKVMFAPVEAADNPNPGKPAFGRLQADGSYVLSTYAENDGAIVGEHWATIISTASKPQETLANNPPRNVLRFSRLTVPQQFRVVAGQENQFDIKLTAKEVARFGVSAGD